MSCNSKRCCTPFHQAVVAADFGGIYRTKNDEEFIDALSYHFDSNEDAGKLEEEQIARKYQAEFPNQPFSKNILKPVLDRLGP